MRRVPPALLALTAGFLWAACDFQEATGPGDGSVPIEASRDPKIKVKDGIIKGPPIQIVAKTGNPSVPGNQRMKIWVLGSTDPAVDITPPPPILDAAPGDWSPDGTQLVFVGIVPPPPPPAPQPPAGYEWGPAIYVMDVAPDGTPDYSTVTLVSSTPLPDFAPSWSPDGAMIAWQCWQNPFPGGPGVVFWNKAICSSQKTSSGWGPTVTLTSDPPQGFGFFIDGIPSWSPQSDQVIFSRIARGCDPDQENPPQHQCPFKSFDIFTVDVATGVETNRTNTPDLDEESPSWEPKGSSTQIAFSIVVGDNELTDLFLGDLGSLSAAIPLVSGPFTDRYPWWAPGGKQVTFTRGPNDDKDVMIVDADGLNLINLTKSPGILDDFARVRPPVITP